MKPLIVLPCYNERENLPVLLKKIFELVPDISILIVDDASPDGTGDLVETYIRDNTFPHLHILHRAGKLGLGTAYIQGFEWGMEQGYDILFSMDADLSHDPQYLPQMLTEIQHNDLVIGSRYVRGGGVRNWSLFRRILSRFGNLYAQIVLMTAVHDLTGGYNCFCSSFLRKIDLQGVVSKGYCFLIEMKFRHVLQKARIKEVPIIFCDRIAGVSKMSGSIFKEAVLNVLKLSLKRTVIKKHMTKENTHAA